MQTIPPRPIKRKVTFVETPEKQSKKKEKAPKFYEPLRPRQLTSLHSFDMKLETVAEEESSETKENSSTND
ncbi:unnamed protein product [Auanema sp. JU1783]|nr:unnamed protein product [Auanema sp. JU1783]